MAVDAASDWRSRGDRGRELSCLYNALKDSLCVAVAGYETPESGIEYLKAETRPAVFDRVLELIRELHVDRSAPPESIGSPGLYHLMLPVHTAWLLSLFAEAGELASVCDDEGQIRFYQQDALWRDYARGVAAVAHSREFTPGQRKYTGYDRHWATYLRLMADLCAGNDASTAVALVDQSFSQRNRDKRLVSDGLDGDGAFPVKWDFRKHSLLLAAGHAAAGAGRYAL